MTEGEVRGETRTRYGRNKGREVYSIRERVESGNVYDKENVSYGKGGTYMGN